MLYLLDALNYVKRVRLVKNTQTDSIAVELLLKPKFRRSSSHEPKSNANAKNPLFALIGSLFGLSEVRRLNRA